MDEPNKKYKTCSRIYIDISFFTDVYTNGEIKEHYHIHFLPGTKDFYYADSYHQGGFVNNHCFKVTNRDTLDEVKLLLLSLYEEAKIDDIDLAITRDGFDVRDMLVNSSVQFSGMVLMRTNGYVSRNRCINDEEINEIFQFLSKNIKPTEKENESKTKKEIVKDFFDIDNGLGQSYSVMKEKEFIPACSIERAREYARLKVEEALNLVKTGVTLLEDGHDVGTELALPAYDTSPNDRYVSINPESVDKIKEYVKF